MIKRRLENIVADTALKGRTTIILGSRQIGKSTLLKSLISKSRKKSILISANDAIIKSQLENKNIEAIKQIIGRTKLLVIEEAQKITNIEEVLKLINEKLPNVKLIISSTSNLKIEKSSSYQINNYKLFPISYNELADSIGRTETRNQLKHRLIFGMYPKIISNTVDEKDKLIELVNNYLYKDILEFDGIRKPSVILNLLRTLALHIGKEINLAEFSNLMNLDRKTIDAYITKLEDAFVVFRLKPLKRNLKNEIGKFQKIYFYDNGIRNALLSAFNPIDLRNDAEELWENFLMSERMKQQSYEENIGNKFFWRTHANQEIDYIEENGNSFSAYEFAWKTKRKVKFPKTFIRNYKVKESKIISIDNYLDFIWN